MCSAVVKQSGFCPALEEHRHSLPEGSTLASAAVFLHLQKQGCVAPCVEKPSLLLSAPAALNSAVLSSVLNLLLCWGIKQLPWILVCIFHGVGVSGDLHVCGVRSHVHPPEDQRFYSGNPNIVPCDQVLTKKSSNPYLGQVQGLEFLIALLPGSAACAALNTFGESRSLLLMV